jgi:hypothetical protein
MSQGVDVFKKVTLLRLTPSLRVPPELVERVIAILEAGGARRQAILDTGLKRPTVNKIHAHWEAGRLAFLRAAGPLDFLTLRGQRPHAWTRIERLLHEERERHPAQLLDPLGFAAVRALEMKLVLTVCHAWTTQGEMSPVGPKRFRFLRRR